MTEQTKFMISNYFNSEISLKGLNNDMLPVSLNKLITENLLLQATHKTSIFDRQQIIITIIGEWIARMDVLKLTVSNKQRKESLLM